MSRGGTAKAGNAAPGRSPAGAAWHFSSCPASPKASGRAGADPAVRRRCDKCTARLIARYAALRLRGKWPCVANVAVARELACWVWEVGCRAEGTLR